MQAAIIFMLFSTGGTTAAANAVTFGGLALTFNGDVLTFGG